MYRLVKVSETSSYETESSVSLQVKFEDQKVIKNSQKSNNKVLVLVAQRCEEAAHRLNWMNMLLEM